MENGLKDARYTMACNFFSDWHKIFKESEVPEMRVEGNSAEAAFPAIKQADCLWRLPDRPDQVYADALPVLHFGKEVGLVSSDIARTTRPEALEAAKSLLAVDSVERWDDPSAWITPYLWSGVVPGCAAKTVFMIGSFEEVAQAIFGFKKKVISQFLFRRYPDNEEMTYFGTGVLPFIRALEAGRSPGE